MVKKKNCSGTRGYNCGNSCISVKYACIKDGLSDNVVKIANKLGDLRDKASGGGGGGGSYSAPLVKDAERQAHRKLLVDSFFGGDEARVKAFEDKVTNLVKDLPIRMAINKSTVEKVKGDGGLLKNLHQTGTTGGYNNIEERTKVENKYLGYEGDDYSKYPKYGYVWSKNLENVATYGDSVYKTDKIDKSQYTVTMGDSLGSSLYSSKADDIKVDSFSYVDMMDIDVDNVSSLEDLKLSNYIEVQIAGDVDMNQFEMERDDLEDYREWY